MIDNWYFMASSVIVLTLVGGLITDKIVEPRLPVWNSGHHDRLPPLTAQENRGLKAAGLAALVFIGAGGADGGAGAWHIARPG